MLSFQLQYIEEIFPLLKTIYRHEVAYTIHAILKFEDLNFLLTGVGHLVGLFFGLFIVSSEFLGLL